MKMKCEADCVFCSGDFEWAIDNLAFNYFRQFDTVVGVEFKPVRTRKLRSVAREMYIPRIELEKLALFCDVGVRHLRKQLEVRMVCLKPFGELTECFVYPLASGEEFNLARVRGSKKYDN